MSKSFTKLYQEQWNALKRQLSSERRPETYEALDKLETQLELLNAVNFGTPEVRILAVCLAGRVSCRSASMTILELMLNEEEDMELRLMCSASLGSLMSKQSWPGLIKALNCGSRETRVLAASALGRSDDDRAVAPLTALLRNANDDAAVRAQAAESLGNLGAISSRPALIAVLQDNSQEVRYWTCVALGQVGTKADLPALNLLANQEDVILPEWGSLRAAAKRSIDQIHKK